MRNEMEIRERIEAIRRVDEIIEKDLGFISYIKRLVANYSKVAISELKWVLGEG